MVMFMNLHTCVLALAAFSSLFDACDFSIATTSSISLFANAAPMPRHGSNGRHGHSGHPMDKNRELKKGGKKSRRQDPSADGLEAPSDSETLGKLMRDYNLLKAALPAAPEGSDLQNALLAEIDHKKEFIFQKFGTIVPDDGSVGNSMQPPTTVSSADGSLVTIYPNPDSAGVIIASNGQNQTVSLGPVGQFPDPGSTAQAGISDQQIPSTSTVGPTPTSTSTVVVVSTSTAPPSGTSTSTIFGSASSTQASASSTKTNAAAVGRPLHILPTSGGMRLLFTVTAAMAFGAWTVL